MSSRKNFLAAACAVLLISPVLHGGEAPPPPGQIHALFDGKTMAGWEGDPKLWRVEDGCLTGGSLKETVKQNVFLASTRDYTNFIVRLQIKLTGSEGFINSGFQMRSQRVPNSTEMSGYQCDYGDPNWWGAIYDESRRNKVMAPSDMAALGPVIKRNDWNDYVIRADGPRITTWLNGAMGADYTEADASIPDWGKFGIQVHGGGKALVQVRNISIEELPPVPPGKRFLGAPEPKKGAKASPLTPAEEQATFSLPPGFEIELVASESEGIGKFVTVDWDLQGRMWSMTALEYPVDANENPAAAKELYASKARDKVLVWDTPFAPGPQQPRVFAEGLAIPLGLLPYKNGVYVQHGTEIVFLSDTDGDGKADQRKTVLSGFGVQDSHLFPHQFTRAPGNWIWMAQGAFNYGKVRTTQGGEVKFDQTRMARFRYDGSDFDITSQGPCNIWGLVLTAEGEAWIQEANDYGYPVMPFHAYANYPGCSDSQFKSYAPEFPGTAPHFQMGGTGLSGLALSDATGGWPEPYAQIMYVANPITRKIQAIKIHRDGPRCRLQLLPDFVRSSDEMFRPVSIHFGPDGRLYIVDWYNKVISHNEVPRNHPDRDKTRGRIWRVKHREQTPFAVPDFARLSGNELLAKLGGESLAQHHLAWQAITDRQVKELIPELRAMLSWRRGVTPVSDGARIGALWALEGLDAVDLPTLKPLFRDPNHNVRREAVRALGETRFAPFELLAPMADDADPEVRAEVIRTAGRLVGTEPRAIGLCVNLARAPLSEPTARSTHNGRIIKVGEAYEREFERYLVRLFLEKAPGAVAAWLESSDAKNFPVENRLVATLALDPAVSARKLADLLPQLTRPPGQEELLRLAEFSDEPSVAGALETILKNPVARAPALDSLLKVRNRLDSAKLNPILTHAARQLLAGDQDEASLGLRLASGFKLNAVEDDIAIVLEKSTKPALLSAALRALREIGSSRAELLAKFARHSDSAVREEAILALAACKSPSAPPLLFQVWPDFGAAQRRSVFGLLAGSKPGAAAIVGAVKSGQIDKADLDASTLEKLHAVLGDDAALAALLREMADLMRPVLRLDGKDDSWVESDITLDGAFTVETWVKLDPGIDNNDGILGAPDAIDMNFFDAKFRVWVGGLHDVIIAKKSIVPDSWTHLAVTRDAAGSFRIYINGELDNDQCKPAPRKFEHCRIGWTAPPRGTAGWLTEYRVWDRARTTEEIRANFDRSFQGESKPPGLARHFAGLGGWSKLHGSAKVEQTSDFPGLLTADEARTLEGKFATFRTLANKTGDSAHGQALFTTICMVCHSVGGQGAQIGPVLNGAGAGGVEALLRNILTPNAAMEGGYRLFRVELKDGEVLDGFLVSQDRDAIVLRRPNSEDQRIPQSQVRRADYTRRSIMPEGLLEGLKPEEVTDLFAYLKTLK
jgi:putative membrane-bound dehydrogenase-like protein